MYDFKADPHFKGIKPFETKVHLASPTIHGEELQYIKEAFDSKWVTTVRGNIKKHYVFGAEGRPIWKPRHM